MVGIEISSMKTKLYIPRITIHPLIAIPDTLVLVRHAESIGNVMTIPEKVAHERANPAYHITRRGVRQALQRAAAMKSDFGKEYFDLCFYSSFRRTRETLGIIVEESGVGKKCTEDSRLDEKIDGIFQNLSPDELDLRYPDQVRMRERIGEYHNRAPGGENCPDVELRIWSFLRDLSAHPAQKVLICCHGTWLLILRRLLESWSVEEYLERKKTDQPANCCHYMYQKEKDGYSLRVAEDVDGYEVVN